MESPTSLTEAYQLLRELDLRRAQLLEYIAAADKKIEAEEDAQCIMRILHERDLLSEEEAARFLPRVAPEEFFLHHEICFTTHARVESFSTQWMKRRGLEKYKVHLRDGFQFANAETIRASLRDVPSRDELQKIDDLEAFLSYVHYHAIPFFYSSLRG